MCKRLFKYILLALLFGGLLYLLVNWGLREYAIRQLSGNLTITDPTLANGDLHTYSMGNFILTVSSTGQAMSGGYPGPRLYITHQAEPGRWLWHTLRGQAFIAAAQGQENVRESRGSFFITDHLARTCANQTIETVQQNSQSVSITGKLDCGQGKFIGYTLYLKPDSANRLSFLLTFTSAESLRPDRTYLTYASDSDEHFFGFGEQFSYFDLKGQRVPIWISEQGIGRGQQPVTALVNLAARSGGNDFTTYTSVPQYITSRLRSLFLENQEYSVFDLRRPDRVQISVFSGQMQGQIIYGSNPEDLIAEYTAWAGRIRALPDWILSGAVVGMQGGTDQVRMAYGKLKALGTPVAAFWLQDWVGQRTTSFGKQLWWNWELDTSRYPGWDALREDLAKDNVHIMLYASPFLADVAGLKPSLRRNLFKEALDNGFLVRRSDGSPYLIRNTDFSAGLMDLSNPQAVTWYKGVLKEQMVDIGASGWMADFGEALPYDARLTGDITGSQYHNQYPVAWSALNRALIDSLPNSDQYVFFTRSGFSQSPRYTTLMWTGDQLTSWDSHDGIKSAVTGMLSGGMSGFSLNHTDIGGYTGINNPLLHVQRSKELLLRWMELAAFTTVYRTHEGNTPDQNAQFYTDEDTLQQFDRFAKVYQAWGFLRKRLVQYAAETGVPVMRPLFIHYPNDPIVYSISYQEFMVGPDVLVAPVLDPGQNTLRVYLPAGNWVHVWTGVPYRSPYKGQWVNVTSPIGQPGVFVKEGIKDGEIFINNLRQAGLIR